MKRHSRKSNIKTIFRLFIFSLLPILPGIADAARTITADVVAFDQVLIFNRFGSFNPEGMMYALRRDVVHSVACPDPAVPCDDGMKIEAIATLPAGTAGNVRLRDNKRPRPMVLRANVGDTLTVTFQNLLAPSPPVPPLGGEPGGPATRLASIIAVGLTPHITVGSVNEYKESGTEGISPGATQTYTWGPFQAEDEGGHLIFSNGAPGGGPGDGGTNMLGLFGAIIVEPVGTTWYRSQVTGDIMGAVDTSGLTIPHLPQVDYNQVAGNGDPLLNMLKAGGANPAACTGAFNGSCETIYTNLNAIIDCGTLVSCNPGPDNVLAISKGSFREFVTIMHDEIEAIHNNELDNEPVFHGVRDGFAINYSASGLGQILLANRTATGPAADCVECLYEEFFLTSWANGDPALLAQYEDDPSGVHHSYNNDRVIFRNLHAGVEEAHVFHLHNHQWLAQQGGENSTYLDSQTIMPFQSFTYDITYGGSGNRNGSIGDSIFHCHLYPHFAQGMWELWRVHDVFENGSRRLPDGVFGTGTNRMTGELVMLSDGLGGTMPSGTPIPAVIPIPGIAMAPIPTYPCDIGGSCTTPLRPNAMPGYPFFIPGEAGHRPPQPPLEMVENGGLPRHIVNSGTRDIPSLGASIGSFDFHSHLLTANITLLPDEGTHLEKAAMAFHCNGLVEVVGTNHIVNCEPAVDLNGDGILDPLRIHETPKPDTGTGGPEFEFVVNGRPPAPGAPFADPCEVDTVNVNRRTYAVSAVGLDLVVNKYGWHDPQARINVLSAVEGNYEIPGPYPNPDLPTVTKAADPFFFRANSGDCIVYKHTNRTKMELAKDAFQVRTPTDTIGQHIHLVKFDVTSSDGSGNGWNYEDGTFSIQAIQERLDAGTNSTDPSSPGSFTAHPDFNAADGGAIVIAAESADADFQTTTQRWYADRLLNGSGVDRTIRTVFTHDHFAPSSIQQHGFYSALLIEPEGSEWYKAGTITNLASNRGGIMQADGSEDSADGVGTQYRIEGGMNNIDHREFAIAVADFALVFEPHGSADLPVNAPFHPEAISVEDPGAQLVNYKNEPIPERISPNGRRPLYAAITGVSPANARRSDLSNIFSSRVHKRDLARTYEGVAQFPDADGDPSTEIFRAYEGDPIQFRLIQGAQEEPHVLSVNGMLWKREISGPSSDKNALYTAAQEIGISEHFEMDVPNLPRVRRGANTADYLYHFNSTRDFWNGPWGFVRSYSGATAADPDDTTKTASSFIEQLPNHHGRITPGNQRTFRRDGCPSGSPNRVFSLEAWTARDLFMVDQITYNKKYNMYDPDAILLVESKDVTALRANPTAHETIEPLVLRANAGDCIKVRLTNRMPAVIPDRDGDPKMTGLIGIPEAHIEDGVVLKVNNNNNRIQTDDLTISTNVGIHPQLLAYDVRSSDGTNVGYNPNQLARRRYRKYYTWYAGTMKIVSGNLIPTPVEFGPINLQPFGDVIKQGPHGLVAGLIIEPERSVHLAEGETCTPGVTSPSKTVEGTVAKIYDANCNPLFKEFVLVYQDALHLDQNGVEMLDVFTADDEEDFGEKGLNYRTEPFCARLGSINLVSGGLPPDCNTKDHVYPGTFLLDPLPETPVFRMTTQEVEEFGQRIRIRAVHPTGPQGERGFFIFGHSFPEGGVNPVTDVATGETKGEPRLPRFGSPGVGYVGAGKVLDAVLYNANDGTWVYRDAIPSRYAAGSWGLLKIGPAAD